MQQRKERDEVTEGTAYGFVAYLLWGAFPLFFHALLPANALEILAHRILWTLVVCLIALLVFIRRWGFVRELWHNPRRMGLVALAGLLIASNWLVYVYAVNTGRTSEAALGYFLNPLVTIALGVVVLGERLRRLQWAAVALGGAACIYLALDNGTLPWIALTLAFSFALYGLTKKNLGGSLTAFESLAGETAALAPIAAITLIVLAQHHETTWSGHGAGHALLLASSGLVTAIPLLLFAAAAARIPLVTIGLLQFITPILQLLCGVFLLGENVPPARWVGFGVVWIALVILSFDSLRAAAHTRSLARASA